MTEQTLNLQEMAQYLRLTTPGFRRSYKNEPFFQQAITKNGKRKEYAFNKDEVMKCIITKFN